jgi:hypothetical protein
VPSLRDQGAVQYFPGDPGTWAITRRGYSLVKFDSAAEGGRYRMALEAILETSTAWDGGKAMHRIASRALAANQETKGERNG